MSLGFPLLITLSADKPESAFRQWQIHPDEVAVVGRAESCQIRIAVPTVSRRHAVLSFRDGWRCKNLSPNGTFADDDRVEEEVLLHDGSEIRCSRRGPRLQIGFPLSQSETGSLPGSVSDCLGVLPYGNDSAERMLWDRYFHRAAALAQKQFGGRARGANDEEDAAICVFRKLFDGVRQGRYPELSDRQSLWRLLATMTSRQTREFLQHENRQKRGGGKVWREADCDNTDPERTTTMEQWPDEDPTPQYVAQLGEQISIQFDKLNRDLSLVAQRKLEGFTNEETAASLGVTVRTVERRLQRIRKLWSTH